MITPILTENIVFDLVNSVDEFPIDFDLAWKWLELNRKDNAKQSLIDCGFVEGVDFRYSLPNQGIETSKPKTSKSINKKAGESQKIWLTTECFKTWGMMLRTQKGKEIRSYFLDCERKMKQLAANPVKTDWVLADLFENDVLSSAIAGLSLVFRGKGKEQKDKKHHPNDMSYADIANALWVAAMSVQTPSPEYDEEANIFPPEVEADNLRFCSMVRDAVAMMSPTEAAKYLTEVAAINPNAGYFHSFPLSMAIPGYQRGDRQISSQEVATLSVQKQKAMQKKTLQMLKKAAFKK